MKATLTALSVPAVARLPIGERLPGEMPMPTEAEPAGAEEMSSEAAKPSRRESVHEVTFVAYPKLLFVWPLILAGIIFYPIAGPAHPVAASEPDVEVAQAADDAASAAPRTSDWLEGVGWTYLWIAIVVVMALGVDVDRNKAAFWLVVIGLVWILGLWLRDAHHFTFFGDIYRWFAGLNVQYDRSFGLALSIILIVPYLIMLLWARLNDRWRITHNEFEHYSFGKMNDSLGRGAKTIRTDFPDVFELLLGLAGTLIVYNATGTKELRRVPHVTLLPFVRRRLDKILERTAITAAEMEEEEDDDEA